MPESAIANRRAALLAHAMPAPDRDWLLSELDASTRRVLGGLLEELRSMGIPRDPALVRQLLDEEAAGNPERSLIDLPSGELAALVDVLRGEPASVAAAFLHARAWPWRDMALRELGVPVRDAFERSALAGAPRFQQALVAAVWRAVEKKVRGRHKPVNAAGRWLQVLRGVKAP